MNEALINSIKFNDIEEEIQKESVGSFPTLAS